MVFHGLYRASQPSILKNISLPRLDLAPLTKIPLSNITNDNRLAINYANQIRHALKNFGIFEIENHGASYESVSNMMEANKNFFNLPSYEKKGLYSRWIKLFWVC